MFGDAFLLCFLYAPPHCLCLIVFVLFVCFCVGLFCFVIHLLFLVFVYPLLQTQGLCIRIAALKQPPITVLQETLRNSRLRNSEGLVRPQKNKKFEGLARTREFLMNRGGCSANYATHSESLA